MESTIDFSTPLWGLPGEMLFALALVVGGLFWLGYLQRAVELRTAALQESEARFRMLFENSPQPMALTENSSFIAANQAALNLFCMPAPEAMNGLTPLSLSPPNQLSGQSSAVEVLQVLSRAQAYGSTRAEWCQLKSNGDTFIAEVLLTAFNQAGKKMLHIVWHDVTGRKEAERELETHRLHLEELVEDRTRALSKLAASLREAHDQQKALFETATAGIVFVRDRYVLRCNRAAERLLGYAPGTMQGRSTREWYPDDATFRAVGEQIKTAHAGSGIYSEEHELVCRDGARKWVRVQGRAVDGSDLSKGVVGVLIDIAQEREALQRIEQARQFAEETARAKAGFLATMSHEIRTPLNAVTGMTHLLSRTSLNERQRDYLGKIEHSSQHLLGVINDILDFSRIEVGKLKLERVEFDLKSVLSAVLDGLGFRAQEKGLELILRLDPALPGTLVGDPLRLEQVLLNLTNNAVKFTEQGLVQISCQGVWQGAQLAGVRFRVKDSGIGIAEAQQAKLFQSFEQIDGATTRKFGGSGLGLAISRQLVELMGGHIGVQSQQGVGSEFWFEIPLRVPAMAEVSASAEPVRESVGYGIDQEAERDTGKPTPSLCDGQCEALYLRLEELLQTDDFTATRFIHSHRATFKTCLGSQFGGLLQAVESFNFPKALKLLRGSRRGTSPQCIEGKG
ncbi:PAS domain S-box protein [Marinobacterium sp. AK62]|uniref:histidine kinase n=1 Tax=Marinobacterium alkalitolerans TaxID=1542925 RepID=A0ABS3Z976_9GAMM|nr:ATP-binding protein [Marinobacterium alkalitolerans]MBP0048258.1 PAS domain S-box protein [Marinobacterium alkalitolerans]